MFQSNMYGGQRPKKKRSNKPKRGGAVMATPAPFGYGYGGAVIPYGYSIAGGAIIGGARPGPQLPRNHNDLVNYLRSEQGSITQANAIELRRAKARERAQRKTLEPMMPAAAAGYGYRRR